LLINLISSLSLIYQGFIIRRLFRPSLTNNLKLVAIETFNLFKFFKRLAANVHLLLPLLQPGHSLPVRALSFTSSSNGLASHLLIGSDNRLLTIHDVKQISNSSKTNEGIEQMELDEDDGQVAALQGHHGWILDVQSSDLNERIVATR